MVYGVAKKRGELLWKWLIGMALLITISGALYWPYWAGTAGATAIEMPRAAPFLQPDPATLTAFLSQVVDEEGFVDYAKAATPEVRQHLDRYLEAVANATPAQFENDNQRLAFYINAYNALTIEGVLFYMPIQSVKDVGYAAYFFREKRYVIAGERVSLHGFESQVIKNYSPLHHFGLNCASISCPPLLPYAYRAEALEDTLRQQAYRYLTDRRHNGFDFASGTWHLSAIFDWYAADFGGQQGVIQFVHTFFPAIAEPERLRFNSYDWGLNAAAAVASPGA